MMKKQVTKAEFVARWISVAKARPWHRCDGSEAWPAITAIETEGAVVGALVDEDTWMAYPCDCHERGCHGWQMLPKMLHETPPREAPMEKHTPEELIQLLQDEIQTLRAQTQISPEAWHRLREIDSVLFGFGVYDPATKKDLALARLLRPHWEALKAHLKF